MKIVLKSAHESRPGKSIRPSPKGMRLHKGSDVQSCVYTAQPMLKKVSQGTSWTLLLKGGTRAAGYDKTLRFTSPDKRGKKLGCRDSSVAPPSRATLVGTMCCQPGSLLDGVRGRMAYLDLYVLVALLPAPPQIVVDRIDTRASNIRMQREVPRRIEVCRDLILAHTLQNEGVLTHLRR